MDSITHPTAAIITPLAVAQMGSIGATITVVSPLASASTPPRH